MMSHTRESIVSYTKKDKFRCLLQNTSSLIVRLAFIFCTVFIFGFVFGFVSCKTVEGNEPATNKNERRVSGRISPPQQLDKRDFFFEKHARIHAFVSDRKFIDSRLKDLGAIRFFMPQLNSISLSEISEQDTLIVLDGNFSKIGQRRSLLRTIGAKALAPRLQNESDVKNAWRYFVLEKEESPPFYFDIGYKDTITVLIGQGLRLFNVRDNTARVERGAIDTSNDANTATKGAISDDRNNDVDAVFLEVAHVDIRDIEWLERFPDVLEKSDLQKTSVLWVYAQRGKDAINFFSDGGGSNPTDWLNVSQWFFLGVTELNQNGESLVSLFVPLSVQVVQKYGSLIKPVIPLLFNSFDVDMISSLPDVTLIDNHLLVRDLTLPANKTDEFF